MFTTKKFRKPYWVDNSKPDTEPIPLDNSPQNAYLKELILKSDKLGAKFASHDSHSWHIDGENANDNYTFSALWGTYLDDLPQGGMGNLIVFPGMHHIMMKAMNAEGRFWTQNAAKGESAPHPKPSELAAK